jgi:hypothetical protein
VCEVLRDGYLILGALPEIQEYPERLPLYFEVCVQCGMFNRFGCAEKSSC